MGVTMTMEALVNTFEVYNLSVFPVQILFVLLGIVVGVVLLLPINPYNTSRSVFIGGCMALLWVWMGVTYFISVVSVVWPLAVVLGVLFILQGLFYLLNTMNGNLVFTVIPGVAGWLGYLLLWYAVLVYPVVHYLGMGIVERVSAVGLPTPSTIAAFGLFAISTARYPRYLLVVPCIWMAIGTMLACRLGLWQDLMLVVAALVALSAKCGCHAQLLHYLGGIGLRSKSKR